MIEETKKTFEFPVLEVVKYDVKNIIAAPEDSWEDDADWGAGEF